MDDFGGLNTDMENINVFDARNDMGDKIVRIQDLARVEVMTEDTCTDLLEELHTACRAESCSSPNEYSLPLSVDEVCNAVNTTSKLKVKVMGDYYDFRNWIVPGGKEPRNTVFLTSETYNGNLGGVAGADANCQTLANNAKLPGTYYAWISDSESNSSPSNRFKRSPYIDSLPYYLVDGRKVAENWAELTNGLLRIPINIDERGTRWLSNPAVVWTNTRTNGDYISGDYSCNEWTSSANFDIGSTGTSSTRVGQWSDKGVHRCDTLGRLYCFQQQDVSYSVWTMLFVC